MPVRCDICGKGLQFGNTVSHSKRHVARRWVPNIQTMVVRHGKTTRRVHVCTRCMRTMHKV